MGGQACVFYGAAEFSRDVDFVLLAEPDNLKRLQSALDELEAKIIAIPPLDESFLNSGLAVHFRCNASGVEGLGIDIMTVMRGVDPFPKLWERRTTFAIEEMEVDLLSLSDLVKAKKNPAQQGLADAAASDRSPLVPTPIRPYPRTHRLLAARMSYA